MRFWRTLLLSAAALPYAAIAAPEIAPIDPPPRAAFDDKVIARGAELSAIGNCADCHTAPSGKPFAGGRAFDTAFGTIYGTNITPDAETGIGRWSEAAFGRALREGVDRRGEHLYPVFPYDHFTKLADADVGALYAFVMSRDPVRARPPPNRVAFPYNVREFIAVWKNLYFEPGRFAADPARSAQWNRGAYLVEGLGHCSACHTPRNSLGAELRDRHFAGGSAGSWHAPALDRSSPSPTPWDAAQLEVYLRTGLVDHHAIAAGPMAPVVRNLGVADRGDVQAMAVYVASWLPREVSNPAPSAIAAAGGDTRSGGAIYADACAECHDKGRTTSSGGALQLPFAIALSLPTPANLAHITLEGIPPREGAASRMMPPFAGALTDAQVIALLQYLRTEVARKPPWPQLDAEVRAIAAEARERQGD